MANSVQAKATEAQASDQSGKKALGKGILVEYLVDHKLRTARAEEERLASQWAATCEQFLEDITSSDVAAQGAGD